MRIESVTRNRRELIRVTMTDTEQGTIFNALDEHAERLRKRSRSGRIDQTVRRSARHDLPRFQMARDLLYATDHVMTVTPRFLRRILVALFHESRFLIRSGFGQVRGEHMAGVRADLKSGLIGQWPDAAPILRGLDADLLAELRDPLTPCEHPPQGLQS